MTRHASGDPGAVTAGGAGTRRSRGRPPGPARGRERVLAAARELFAERGYDAASVRAVAARAGVDPALVHHHFGTKQRLFLAASRFPVDVLAVVPDVLAGSPDGMGERLVRYVVELWDRPEVRPLLLGVVRSASTDPTAAAMVRGMLSEGPFLAIARSLAVPDAERRAGLVGSQLVGLVMVRYILAVEPLASMEPAGVAAAVGPTIQRYLTGAVRLPADPPAG